MEIKEADKKEKFYEKVKKVPIWLVFTILLIIISLLWLYQSQIPYFEIKNDTVKIANESTIFYDLSKLVTIIGVAGLIGLASLYMYHRQASAAEKQTKIMERQASAAEKQTSIMQMQASVAEKNILENQKSELITLYNKAISQLGSKRIEVRLGAISTLEIIVNKSSDCYLRVMNVFTAYLRDNSSVNNEMVKNENAYIKIQIDKGLLDENEIFYHSDGTAPMLSSDIQSILTFIRKHSSEVPSHLDLQKTYLRNADLQKVNLTQAKLKEADFTDADLNEANLENADLSYARLVRANLQKANLKNANLSHAFPVTAKFRSANLERANFVDAKVMTAFFDETNLEGANLSWANLSKTSFVNNTKLVNANLLYSILVIIQVLAALL